MIKKKIIQKKILKRIHYFISFKSYYKKKLFLLKYLKSSLMVYLNLKFKFPYKFDLTNQVTIFLLIQFFFLYYNNFLLAEEVSLETINEIAKDSIIEITGKFKEELIKNIIESIKKIPKEDFEEITPELERKIIKNIIEGAEEGAKQVLRERSKSIPEEIIKEAIKEGIEEATEELKAEIKEARRINSIIF